MKKIFFAILCLPLSFAAASAQDLESGLKDLDAALEMAPVINEAYQKRLNTIESLVGKPGQTDRQLFQTYCQLYDGYFSYQYDKTLEVAERLEELAKKIGDKSSVAEAQLRKARLYSTAGMYLEASTAMASIDTVGVSKDQMLKYYYLQQSFSYDFREYTGGDNVGEHLMDNVYRYRKLFIDNTAETEFYHRHLEMLTLLDRGLLAQADSLGASTLAMLDPSSHEFAIAAYFQGVIRRDLGDPDGEIGWFIRSAIADIRSSTMDNASLQSVAIDLLHNYGDVERAFRYTQISLDNAMFYNAKLRPLQIARQLPDIETAYRQLQEKHEARNNALLHIILLMVAVLLAICVLLLYYHRRLRGVNRELVDANAAKEEYLALFLSMSSRYLDKLKRHLTMDQMDEELKNFYNSFDNAFLQIYPDFVEQFNCLLKPEARVELKKDELLNTELRIFALIRMGITQSSHIASLLRYSVNTIYNYRAQVKSAALNGKENFEDQVRTLGNKL